MSSTPKVSVVIPCYDLGRYVDKAVESVLAQTFQDFEIVVVDDGSTDPTTTRLLSDYDRPRTRVVSIAHRGLAAARNVGIAETTGPYVCALDADDRLEPTFLEKAARLLDEDASIDFVSAWLRRFDGADSTWQPERCDLVTLLAEDTVLTSALVRREAVLAVGGYDEKMPAQGDEDWDLWLSLVERGGRGVILPEVLFHYRVRPGSMSSVCSYGPAHLDLTRYLVAKHAASYRRHLVDVLLRKEADIAALLRANDELERQIETRLFPEVSRRRAERDALLQKLRAANERRDEPRAAPLETRVGQLEAALHRAEEEVRALRESMSWRVTAPLRTAYAWLLRAGGRV